jgi:TP901 family phage tail tape measure protein
MSTRNAKVILELMVDKFISNSKKAAQAQEDVAKASEQAGKSSDQSSEQQVKASEKAAAAARKQADAQKEVGEGLLKFGAVSVAALGASAKAAMDWESAWAGVTKTVDGSPEQMAALESGLRGLAKTLPSTHKEIAGVAEAAGQLGVKREDILKFTKTMVDLGETTNLTAEEAATDIAQSANVMGTSGDEIDNFGSALVALGNDGASTEKDILSMAQRIAGAGKLVGASEADVLALSNTLASMGVKAELGGGVATRALLKMYAAVQAGGPKLDAFATAAGTSSEQFAKAFRESPVAALEMVTKGMARTKDEGGNVVEMLKTMGLKGTEEMQVMLALAGAGDLLSDSLALGSKAWEENTALINEASKRYETTESKVKVAWNNIKDAAIDAGAVMLPVISGIAENVAGLAQGFGQLPAPLQGAITGLAGVAGVGALVLGSVLTLAPKIRDTADAFKTFNTRADGSSRGLGKLAGAAGIAAGAFIGFEIIKAVHNSMQKASVSTEEMTQNLLKLAKSKDSIDNVFKDIGLSEFEGDIDSAGAALKKLTQQDFNTAVESFGATALGIDNGMAKITKAFEKSDQAIAGAVSSGNMDLAARGFKSIAKSAEEHGVSIEETAKKFPTYLNALRDLASQNKVQVSDAELLKWAMGEVPPEMKKVAGAAEDAAAGVVNLKGATGQTIPITKEIAEALAEVGVSADGSVADIDRFTQALLNTGLLTLSARDASRGWSQALLDLGLKADGTGGAIGSLGTAFDNTTEQGIKNQAMFDGVAQAGIRNVQAMAKNKASNEDVQGALKGTYDGLIAAAGQFGKTGDEAINLARDVLGVPDGVTIDSWMDSEAKRMAQETTGELNKIDGRVVRTYTEHHETTFIRVDRSDSVSSGEGTNNSAQRKLYAGGGEITGSGPKGVDSELIMAAPGEHMLTTQDVALMGGQDAVYRFRQQLRAGTVKGFAGGGAVGSTPSRAVANSQGVSAPAVSIAGMQLVGTMKLNADATMATFRGIARQEAGSAVDTAGRDIARGRSI